MTTKKTRNERFTVEYRVDVDITDAKELESAALEHATNTWHDPADSAGLADAFEFIRGGPGAALIELFDPDRLLDLVPGVAMGQSEMSAAPIPGPNPYDGPGSKNYPDERAHRDEVINTIVAWAPAAKGIDGYFNDPEPDDDFPDERTPEEKAQWEKQVVLLKGLLWYTSKRVIAQLFDDVVMLATTASVSGSTIEDTQVLSQLPGRFASLYNLGFAQKFTAATIDVSKRLASGWWPLSTVAEELALHVILDDAEFIAELWELDLAHGWRGDLVEMLYEDTDHQYLFDDRFSGFETEPNFGPHGMAPMGFSSWFVVFNEAYLASPYAQDLAPADPYEQQVPVNRNQGTPVEADEVAAVRTGSETEEP